jgi:[acyl-carrier-protein] S-malonyltransferase/trans-AT polyketide synthase/acyltransferase/oxidoreductase domain-containing protein
MQEAVPVGVGGMAAIISENIDIDMLKKLMKDLPVDVANINSANQVVISGELSALSEIERRLTQTVPSEKSIRFVRLNVSAPFHSRLMKTIENRFADTLEKFGKNLNPQNASKVTSNFTGGFHSEDIAGIREKLVNQLSNTVHWRENMQNLAAKAEIIYEIGPARPLREFFKTIGVACQSITGFAMAEKNFSSSN